jgi:hypothetical protein
VWISSSPRPSVPPPAAHPRVARRPRLDPERERAGPTGWPLRSRAQQAPTRVARNLLRQSRRRRAPIPGRLSFLPLLQGPQQPAISAPVSRPRAPGSAAPSGQAEDMRGARRHGALGSGEWGAQPKSPAGRPEQLRGALPCVMVVVPRNRLLLRLIATFSRGERPQGSRSRALAITGRAALVWGPLLCPICLHLWMAHAQSATSKATAA